MSTPTSQEILNECGEHLGKFLEVYAAGAPGIVFEIRAIKVPQRYGKPKTLAGFFQVPETDWSWKPAEDQNKDPFRIAIANAVGALVKPPPEMQPEAVWISINPVNPDLLGRANHRLKDPDGEPLCANDADVVCRRWLPVDVDTIRTKGVSASDAEKAEAWKVVQNDREDLAEQGWPDPMVIDSANGYHCWYPLDLPTEDNGVVQNILLALAAKHTTLAAKVDTANFNASRMFKLPGTFGRKGDSIPKRPHRMARVLEVPSV